MSDTTAVPTGFNFVPTRHDDTYDFINPLKASATDLKVLVTGASKGIGRATVVSFAKSGASAIALLARSDLDSVAKEVIDAAKQAGHKEPPKVLQLRVDTTDVAAVDRAVKTVEQEFGALDVVINNASRMETWKPIHETDVQDWWSTWEVNIKGTYLVSRATLPLLLKGKKKTMIVISSAGGLTTSAGGSAYQGTKTAQIRFNDFLMKEYGEQGLLAYAVHPGGVKTEVGVTMPEHMHYLLTAEPELPADTLVWLTRERRDWLAGRYVNAPWDMQELEGKKDEIVEKDLLKLKLQV
ncbi:uncharacterized protein Z520_08191 [Fonsecaea multimorphosa CBS 102226]|uniref:Uncharacterized protein n=1 Tax=Fonsecaea multimorphosa CBS 102226 TaxID=1442371 RepID=A0A0D2IFV2_9EURO|nr:uncharacterized protein Z520_08191 [Fonsecaea multimorphosa CBS 102226]KIX95936.1 hypothetical protein Z520_08191 [Fonsecaea multimorphosa CBS 102226]OAL21707.1 hypothetical protein AYO22_07649 [Fonsecaea multimorphosa]